MKTAACIYCDSEIHFSNGIIPMGLPMCSQCYEDDEVKEDIDKSDDDIYREENKRGTL